MEFHGIIIQARMGSRRFPGKCLAKLDGKPVLEHVVDRCKQATQKVVVAIPTTVEDRQIADWCIHNGVAFTTGPEHNVLARYVMTARHHSISRIVRVNADCPFIEPERINELVNKDLLTECSYEYIGYDVSGPAITKPVALPELVSLACLQKLNTYAAMMEEHVTWGCHTPLKIRATYLPWSGDPDRQWTIDVPDDLKRLEAWCRCIQSS